MSQYQMSQQQVGNQTLLGFQGTVCIYVQTPVTNVRIENGSQISTGFSGTV